MTTPIILYNAQQGNEVFRNAWIQAKPKLLAGRKLSLLVKDATRSVEQNAKLHALLTDISEQIEWASKKRSVECWKRLITAAWLRARGEAIEMLPAIDGHGIDVVWRPTSTLTVGEASELLEYALSWAATNGVNAL